MYFFLISLCIVSGFYILLQLFHIYHWKKITTTRPPQDYTPHTSLSVLVAARNEEDHILQCIYSLLAQNYPKHLLEIIIVDDQSEDGTYEICEEIKSPNVKLMRLGIYRKTTIQGSKKKALSYGISHATGELIVTTDADCQHHPEWLLHIAYEFETKASVCISGPVNVFSEKGMLSQLQLLDFTGNGLINAAGLHAHSHYLASGANLCFKKDLAEKLNLFDGNYHVASGDDVYMLNKYRKAYKNQISYLKSPGAIVHTHPESGWSAFISQRLRWASKTKNTGDAMAMTIAILVWTQRAMLFLTIGFSVYTKNEILFFISLGIMFLVIAVDFILQYIATGFFLCRKSLRWFLPVWPIHSFYFLCIGILSWIPLSPVWKGRRI